MLQSIPEPVRKRLIENRRRRGKTPYYRSTFGHWIWQGHTGRTNGYGWVSWLANGRETGMNAHRAVYIAFKGPIPADLDVDHECRESACVNPEHMQPVTTQANLQRGALARSYFIAPKTHCPHGHPYDGHRCWECTRIKGREAYARKMDRPLRVYRRTAPYKQSP